MPTDTSMHCFERLKEKIDQYSTPICIGIDPHVAGLQGFFQEQLKLGPAVFLQGFTTSLVDVAHDQCSSVKFQAAFYERFGAEGITVLKEGIAYAKSKGLVTILDAKRGDISSTMAAYGDMAFEYFDADALTVLPYMGVGVLTPLKKWFDAGRGVYQVWISSNPDGLLLQSKVAALLIAETVQWAKTQKVNLAQIGLVLGATKVADLEAGLLEQARNFHLLLPGFGAQGAGMSLALADLMQRAPSCLLPVSRGIAGIGLADQAERLLEIRSWRNYRQYSAERFEIMSSLDYPKK